MKSEVEVCGYSLHCFHSVESASKAIIKYQQIKNSTLSLVALNPEKIVTAESNSQLKGILSSADVLYADGVGVVKAVKRKYGFVIPRIPGCELWEEFALKSGLRIFLLGGTEDVVKKTYEKLTSNPNVKVVGVRNGYFDNEDQIIQEIINSKAEFVSVALGSPRQELFIEKCRTRNVSAIFMGVGGTYDVYTGTVKRAPYLFRKLNLEWFYRLICQPSRFFRQLNLIRFLIWLLCNKL